MRRAARSTAGRARPAGAGVLSRFRPAPGDEGMSLVELMVSLVIFSIAATAIASGFIAAIKTSGNDRGRLAANNLAQREVEIVRNIFTANESGPQNVIDMIGSTVNPNPLPGGTAGRPLVIDGRPYTVTRTVGWLPGDVGQSACDGTSAVKYAKLTLGVKVSWPSMNTAPVQTNTVLTPPKGVLNTNLAWVAVKVTKADGKPSEGQTVYLKVVATGVVSDATTASDGCAVFGVATTGAHTVYLNESGHVDIGGVQLTERSINVTTGSFQRLDISYDKEATLVTRLTTDPGFAVPAGVTNVFIANTVLTSGKKSYTAGSTSATTIPDLWPASDGYGVWAGSCNQSDPALNGGRAQATKIAPGATSAEVPARLTPLALTARSGNGTGPVLSNVEIVAVPWSLTGCSTAERRLVLGRTAADGTLKTSVPAGQWDFEVAGYTEPAGTGWAYTPAKLNYNSPLQTIVVKTP